MLQLLKFFLQKIDFLAISELLRKRENRLVAAQLHVILVQSYEIIEIYHVLLDELESALKYYQRVDDQEYFFLNPARIANLLSRQASNLAVMERLTFALMGELRILDNKFAEAYRDLMSGKAGILSAAQTLLEQSRLPLVETDPHYFPTNIDGEYRTLWFTWDSPKEDRGEIEQYLYGFDGSEKIIIDVNIHDGDKFFKELARYFEKEDPIKRLSEIEDLTVQYRDVLLKNFSVDDLLGEIGKIRRHHN
jgi:hypothetical protein